MSLTQKIKINLNYLVLEDATRAFFDLSLKKNKKTKTAAH